MSNEEIILIFKDNGMYVELLEYKDEEGIFHNLLKLQMQINHSCSNIDLTEIDFPMELGYTW